MVSDSEREIAQLQQDLTSKNPAARTNAQIRLQQFSISTTPSGSGGESSGGGGSSSSSSSSSPSETAQLELELQSKNPAARRNAELRLQQLNRIKRAEQNLTMSAGRKPLTPSRPQSSKEPLRGQVEDTFLNRFFGRGQFQDLETAGQVKPLKKTPFQELTPQQRRTDLRNALIGGTLVATSLTPIPDELIAVPFVGRVLQIGQFTSKSVLFGTAVGEAAEETTKATAKRNQRELLLNRQDLVSPVTKRARQDVASQFPGVPLPGVFQKQEGKVRTVKVGEFLESTPIINLLPSIRRPELFEQSVREQAKARGLSKKETETLVSAAKRQRSATDIGNIGELFGAEFQAELAGTKFLKEAGLKKIKEKPFRTVFKEITQAGIVESVGSDLTNVARGQEQFSPGKTAVQTAIAAPFAGLLGGFVGKAAVQNKPVRKFLGVQFGRAIDFPGEPIGDILGGIAERGFVTPVSVPGSLSSVSIQTEDNLRSQTKEGDIRQPKPSGRKPRSNLPRTTFEQVLQLQPTTPTPVQTNLPSPSVPTPALPVPTEIKIGVPVDITITEPVRPTTPIAPAVPISVSVPTAINIPTLSNIPTVVPVGLIPPLLPNVGAPRGGGLGGLFKPGKEFVNELEAGNKALNNLLGGFNLPGSTPPPKPKPKKTKKKGKKKRQPQGLDVFELLFG